MAEQIYVIKSSARQTHTYIQIRFGGEKNTNQGRSRGEAEHAPSRRARGLLRSRLDGASLELAESKKAGTKSFTRLLPASRPQAILILPLETHIFGAAPICRTSTHTAFGVFKMSPHRWRQPYSSTSKFLILTLPPLQVEFFKLMLSYYINLFTFRKKKFLKGSY